MTLQLEVVNKFWLELAWLGAKCKDKTLPTIEFFFTFLWLHCHSPVLVLSIQSKTWSSFLHSLAEFKFHYNYIPDHHLIWRVVSTTHWTLRKKYHDGRAWQGKKVLPDGLNLLLVVYVKDRTGISIFCRLWELVVSNVVNCGLISEGFLNLAHPPKTQITAHELLI